MSGELEAMADGLYTNQVPAVWAKVAYPSLKPLSSWMKDLAERVAFMRKWLVGGAPHLAGSRCRPCLVVAACVRQISSMTRLGLGCIGAHAAALGQFEGVGKDDGVTSVTLSDRGEEGWLWS